MKEQSKPDITLTDGEWTVKQTYCWSDLYSVTYLHGNKERYQRIGDYKTEQQLRKELEHAGETIRRLDRDYEESLIDN